MLRAHVCVIYFDRRVLGFAVRLQSTSKNVSTFQRENESSPTHEVRFGLPERQAPSPMENFVLRISSSHPPRADEHQIRSEILSVMLTLFRNSSGRIPVAVLPLTSNVKLT